MVKPRQLPFARTRGAQVCKVVGTRLNQKTNANAFGPPRTPHKKRLGERAGQGSDTKRVKLEENSNGESDRGSDDETPSRRNNASTKASRKRARSPSAASRDEDDEDEERDDDDENTSDDESSVDPECTECGKSLKRGQRRYKRMKAHHACGRKRISVLHAYKSDPQMMKKINKLRVTDKPKYWKLMCTLGDKPMGSRMKEAQRIEVADAVNQTERITRSQGLTERNAYLLCDEEEFVQHWKTRKGWSTKKCKRHYRDEWNKKGAYKKKLMVSCCSGLRPRQRF